MIRLILVSLFEILWCVSNLILKPRMISYEKGLQREVSCNKFDLKTYQNREKKRFSLESDYGYQLSCELVEAEEQERKKVVILCHGFGYAKYGSIKYMEFFLRLGYCVLLYDHRNHGKSGKAFTSMGFYEKFDLKRVVDWCYDYFGGECVVVTHGESMGAATVLLHLGIDDRIQCAISDCGYSDLKQLLMHQMKQYYHFPRFLIPIESLLTYLRAGFWYQQVSPLYEVCRTDTPILFIHGKGDNLVPADMSRQMYIAKRKNKAIYLVAKAKHAESYCMNKQGYETRVEEFLNQYIK